MNGWIGLVSAYSKDNLVFPSAFFEFSRDNIYHIYIIIGIMILCTFRALASIVWEVTKPEVNNISLGILLDIFNNSACHFFNNVRVRIAKLSCNRGVVIHVTLSSNHRAEILVLLRNRIRIDGIPTVVFNSKGLAGPAVSHSLKKKSAFFDLSRHYLDVFNSHFFCKYLGLLKGIFSVSVPTVKENERIVKLYVITVHADLGEPFYHIKDVLNCNRTFNTHRSMTSVSSLVY